MSERIKELRERLNLSQEALGARVGVTRGAISRIENGTNSLTPAMILSLCREFNVREEWLREGTGEMFNELSQEEEVAYIVGQALPQAPDFIKDTFIALGKLSHDFTPEDWQAVKKFIDALAGKK